MICLIRARNAEPETQIHVCSLMRENGWCVFKFEKDAGLGKGREAVVRCGHFFRLVSTKLDKGTERLPPSHLKNFDVACWLSLAVAGECS